MPGSGQGTGQGCGLFIIVEVVVDGAKHCTLISVPDDRPGDDPIE